MEPTELDRVERRFRRIYEVARLKRAIIGFLPVAALVVGSVVFGGRPGAAVVLGPLLFASGVLALWYGREAGRGVLPGALGGGAALVLALCANQMGHFCTGDQCVSWCLPACITGGVLAGGLVSAVGVRQRRGRGYWVSASAVTLLTGALGCSCVGFAGLIGLVAGFVVVATVPFAASLRRAAP